MPPIIPVKNPRVHIPKIVSIETAIRLYLENIELGNAELRQLFGKKSTTIYSKLKKQVREYMTENNIKVYSEDRVQTEAAYKVWGIDIEKLERNYAKLRKYEMLNKPESEVTA